MIIKFEDFIPQVEKSGWGLGAETKGTGPKELVTQVNKWVKNSGVDVINIETVVVPTVWPKNYESKSITEIRQAATCLQIIRVWYKE